MLDLFSTIPELKLFGFDFLLTLIFGVAILIAVVAPRFLRKLPCSMPMILLGFGIGVTFLPFDLPLPDFRQDLDTTENFTCLAVIISLMGAGLKIDRRIGLRRWEGTWRLIAITMVITILISALAGWWIGGLIPAAALLFGAVVAPTDPVLASEIQVGPPGELKNDAENVEEEREESGITEEEAEEEDERAELRFTLTSEAGLNDGLAFPFVSLAVALMILVENPQEDWLGGWIAVHVVYKLTVGIVVGILIGRILGKGLLSIPGGNKVADALMGPTALAATLILYGASEYLGGYGFLAVFVGAIVLRWTCWDHHYHDALHRFAEMVERLLSALFLIVLGASIGRGLLQELSLPMIIVAVIVILVARPLGGVIGLLGFTHAPWRERLAISFFGIRGVGSFYYLAHALNVQTFPDADLLWASVGLVVALSVLIHGITAMPVIRHLQRAGMD